MSFEQKAITGIQYSIVTTLICCCIVFFYALLFRKGKRIKIGDVLITILLICISSLRYDVGTDYDRYIVSAENSARIFSGLKNVFSAEVMKQYSYEVGYEALSVITSRISSSEYAIFWVTSVLMYVPLMFYCRKHTSNAFIAFSTYILFGFWGMSLNIIKQSIAMIAVLFYYEAIKQKKYIACLILAVFAQLYHTTSIVAVVFIFLCHFNFSKTLLKPTRRNLYMVTSVGILLRISTGFLFRILSHISIFAKYIKYLDGSLGDSLSRSFIMIDAFLEAIIVFGFLYVAIGKIRTLKRKNSNIEKIISFIMVGLLFNIVGISKTLWLSKRFAEFFYIFLIVLIPDLLGTRKARLNNHGVGITRQSLVYWAVMIIWHIFYAVLSLDNHGFQLQTYLFRQ